MLKMIAYSSVRALIYLVKITLKMPAKPSLSVRKYQEANVAISEADRL